MAQGYPNVAQLTMTAQFYRQDALTRPNLTQRGPNLAQICVILQRQQEKHHQLAFSFSCCHRSVTQICDRLGPCWIRLGLVSASCL